MFEFSIKSIKLVSSYYGSLDFQKHFLLKFFITSMLFCLYKGIAFQFKYLITLS